MDSEKIVIEYKSYKIRFDQYDEEWSLLEDDGGTAYSNKSLKAVKLYVDKIGKNQRKFDAVDAYYTNYELTFEKVKITSRDEEGQYWISRPDHSFQKRSKVGGQCLVKVTDANNELINKIAELSKEYSRIYNEREKLSKQLERYGKER